ncbi:dynein axonemal heavy chain 12-like [Phyllobates terribilis]|uniref:dynein axonemal heavy chain 12-like n=1 Tax=Phyllobates terribilis TaxID=111132 RepID=UPI003CCAC22C
MVVVNDNFFVQHKRSFHPTIKCLAIHLKGLKVTPLTSAVYKVEHIGICILQTRMTDVRTVQKRIADAEEAVAYINKEEALYKWDLTTYPQLDSSKVNIEPYQKLFALIYKWQKTEKKWIDGTFLDLNGESMEAEVDEFLREVYKMMKLFQQKQKTLEEEKKKAAQHRTLSEDKDSVDEEKKESRIVLMCSAITEQIKAFKVDASNNGYISNLGQP